LIKIGSYMHSRAILRVAIISLAFLYAQLNLEGRGGVKARGGRGKLACFRCGPPFVC